MTLNRWAVFANMNRNELKKRINSKVTKKKDWFKGTEIGNIKRITVGMVDIKLRTDKICGTCELPMKNLTKNNQSFCVYTTKEKKRLKVEETPCQKTGRIIRMKGWRKGHKTGEKKVEAVFNTTKRRCLSSLSYIEPHWFESKGKYNRVCDECHEVDEVSKIYNRPAKKIVLSKKQSTGHNE